MIIQREKMIIQREKMIIQRVCERDCLSKTLGRKKLIPFEAKKLLVDRGTY